MLVHKRDLQRSSVSAFLIIIVLITDVNSALGIRS